MQTRHLIATAVERVAVLGGVYLVLVRQAIEVSAFGRCSARLLREQVVYDGAALGVAALVGLQRERKIVCLLGTGLTSRSVQARRGRCVRLEAGSWMLEAGPPGR